MDAVSPGLMDGLEQSLRQQSKLEGNEGVLLDLLRDYSSHCNSNTEPMSIQTQTAIILWLYQLFNT